MLFWILSALLTVAVAVALLYPLLKGAAPAPVDDAGEAAVYRDQLKELERSGLISQRRESRSIIYSASYEALADLVKFLMEDCCAGAPQICAPLSAIVSGGMACGTAKA